MGRIVGAACTASGRRCMSNRDATILSNDSHRVAVAWGPPRYGVAPPFDPSRRYPESPGPHMRCENAENSAYESVRESLRLLGLDSGHVDTPRWNPLRGILRPGDRVVIKPN